MDWLTWYNALAKPAWTPDPSTIGLIWKVLYPILAVTWLWVLVQCVRKKLPWAVAVPFAINAAANFAFTPIQFGLRNLPLATADILVVWITIVWSIVVVWRHSRWVALAQVPYLVWVSIATILQIAITLMNPGE